MSYDSPFYGFISGRTPEEEQKERQRMLQMLLAGEQPQAPGQVNQDPMAQPGTGGSGPPPPEFDALFDPSNEQSALERQLAMARELGRPKEIQFGANAGFGPALGSIGNLLGTLGSEIKQRKLGDQQKQLLSRTSANRKAGEGADALTQATSADAYMANRGRVRLGRQQHQEDLQAKTMAQQVDDKRQADALGLTMEQFGEAKRHNLESEKTGRIAATRPQFVGLTPGVSTVMDTRSSTTKKVEGNEKPMGARGGAMGERNMIKQYGDFYKALEPDKDQKQRLNAGDRLEALIQTPEGHLINLTKPELREAGTGLAAMISTGSVSEHQINELVPSSMAADWSALKSKVLNEPQGAEAQKFLERMLNTIQREHAIVSKQVQEQQRKRLPQWLHLRENDPDRFDRTIGAYGFDPGEWFDEDGKPKAAGKPGGGHGAAAPPPASALHPDEEDEFQRLQKKYGGAK